MATWSEQINTIQNLRVRRREADDELYAAKIALLRAESNLKKIENEELNGPPDLPAINALRKKIAELENLVQDLNKKINAFNDLIEKIRQTNEKISSVEKTISLLRRDPGRNKNLIEDLNNDLAQLKRELTLLQRQRQNAEATNAELQQQRKGLLREIALLQARLNDQLQPQRLSADEAEGKKKELEEKKKRARANFDDAVNNLNLAVEAIYVDHHPSSVVSNLDDSIPVLLLPVRIETRFMTKLSPAELWIRIYPDDIAIHTHEKTLADDEIREGEKYWAFILDAEKNEGAEREQLKKNAWSHLVSQFSSQRSAWIAKETKPVNWNEVVNTDSTAQIIFPTHEQSKPFAWSRAPRTNVLPDKFVVMLYQGNTIVKELIGPVIPDELFVGPDPLEAEQSFKKAADDNTLTFGSDYDWTSDFEKAIAKGMGFKTTLNADEAVRGFDKILVLGVYASANDSESKRAIETLIDNHHYSPKGFAIVKQGTPTNNTEQDGSGFSKSDPFDNISFFVETGKTLFDEDDDCDGKNLANALGIEYDPLHYVANSDAKDLKEAVAMNTALYPSTLGYYFSTMMKPVLTEPAMDTLRDFFIRHVSGRGPLPAIRVGDQPYGILLTSDFSNWQWKQTEVSFGNPFLNVLYKTLVHYNNIWKSLLDQLMYTGKPGADPSEVLMNILGLQSNSVSFFQRNAFTTEQLANRAEFEYGGKYFTDLISSFVSKGELLDFLRTSFGFVPPTVDGKPDIPQLLRLVYQHYHTRLNTFNVVENFPLSEDQALHNYTDDKNYIHWLAESTSVLQLERQEFGPDIKPPTSLLYMQLRRSLLLAMADASVNWFKKNNIVLNHVMKATSFHNIRPARDLTKWEVMKGKISNALPQHPQKDKAVAEHLLTTGQHESEAAFLNKMKESLGFLAGVSTASLERTFIEHIDTCTYRLDAWQTAIFDQRLRKQRRLSNNAKQPERRKGIYLGAFGWVEDIRPGTKRQIATESLPSALQPPGNNPVYEYADNGGFVHAPSINQATAAAVLRSGYLSHASAGNSDVMAVNLSSGRVRQALFVLEGLRNGQTLEALLGFQFERGLHERGSASDELKRLNEYIYDFRDKFKINRHLVKQEGVNDTTTETIETNNVVNGLTLADTEDPYPYGVSLDLTGLNPSQLAAIESAIKEEKDRLEDTLDAIKDLFLSESVFQMVQGNFDRAAAITTALRDANIPPSIEVIDTPVTNHLSFTNRVTIQFDASETFAGTSHRARMEAGINKWLRKITGEPSDLICLVSHTAGDAEEQEEISIADCNLEPVDLIYILANDFEPGKNNAAASELESRIAYVYRDKNGLDDDVIVKLQFMGTASDDKKFLGTVLPVLKKLKQIITDSRPLHAQDFDSPSKPVIPDKSNPHGYVIDKLAPRVDQAKEDFEGYLLELRNISIIKIEGELSEETSLGEIFDELDDAEKDFNDIQFSFSVAGALSLQNLMISISGFGLADSFPQVKDITGNNRKIILLEQARNIARNMAAIIDKANELSTKLGLPENSETAKKVAILIETGKTLFGDSFNILPRFNYNNPTGILQSNAARDQLLAYAKNNIKMKFPVDEWIQKTSAVRTGLARWDEVRAIYELDHDDQLELEPLQLPYRANDSWLAVEFPEKNPDDSPFDISGDTLSIVIHGDVAFATATSQCGLLIDDWTEVVPGKEAITGLTFNYNQPDAMPPQALLLAVTPEEKGKWTWDVLVGILNDTLLRSRLRAVEPQLLDKLKRADTGVLLPAVISVFSQQGLDISLDYRNNVTFYENNLPLTAIG